MSTENYQGGLRNRHFPLDSRRRSRSERSRGAAKGNKKQSEEAIKIEMIQSVVLDCLSWIAEEIRLVRPCRFSQIIDLIKYGEEESDGKSTYESMAWEVNSKLATIQLSCRDAYPVVREKISLLGTWIDERYEGVNQRLTKSTIVDVRTEISDKIEEIFG